MWDWLARLMISPDFPARWQGGGCSSRPHRAGGDVDATIRGARELKMLAARKRRGTPSALSSAFFAACVPADRLTPSGETKSQWEANTRVWGANGFASAIASLVNRLALIPTAAPVLVLPDVGQVEAGLDDGRSALIESRGVGSRGFNGPRLGVRRYVSFILKGRGTIREETGRTPSTTLRKFIGRGDQASIYRGLGMASLHGDGRWRALRRPHRREVGGFDARPTVVNDLIASRRRLIATQPESALLAEGVTCE